MESDKSKTTDAMAFAAGVLTLAIIVWFYGFVPRYGIENSRSVLGWLMSAWNGETQLEFGNFAPLLILALIGYRFRDLRIAMEKSRT